jgi:hypothetical protein
MQPGERPSRDWPPYPAPGPLSAQEFPRSHGPSNCWLAINSQEFVKIWLTAHVPRLATPWAQAADGCAFEERRAGRLAFGQSACRRWLAMEIGGETPDGSGDFGRQRLRRCNRLLHAEARFALLQDTPVEGGKRWVVVAPQGAGGSGLLLAKAADERQRRAIGTQAGGRVFLFLYTDDFRRDYAAFTERGVVFVDGPRLEPSPSSRTSVAIAGI